MVAPGFSEACSPYVEAREESGTASFRLHINAFERCAVSEATYALVVGAWLRERSPGLPPLVSLSLGRAVDFPWISRYLADAALRQVSPVGGASPRTAAERHRLAGKLLNEPALLRRLAVPFEGSPYQVTGVSYEKVLFGNAGEYSSNRQASKVKVPFDAQIWLQLKLREPLVPQPSCPPEAPC